MGRGKPRGSGTKIQREKRIRVYRSPGPGKSAACISKIVLTELLTARVESFPYMFHFSERRC